jgi:hypothetical protein
MIRVPEDFDFGNNQEYTGHEGNEEDAVLTGFFKIASHPKKCRRDVLE